MKLYSADLESYDPALSSGNQYMYTQHVPICDYASSIGESEWKHVGFQAHYDECHYQERPKVASSTNILTSSN